MQSFRAADYAPDGAAVAVGVVALRRRNRRLPDVRPVDVLLVGVATHKLARRMSKDSVVVGFVGLGTMGGRMAANVQKAGLKLVVHDLHRQAASHHIEAGAVWADSGIDRARHRASTCMNPVTPAQRVASAWRTSTAPASSMRRK